MKRLSYIVVIAAAWVFVTSITGAGCKKETIIKETKRDTIIYRDTVLKEVVKDSMTIVRTFMTKKWTLTSHEYEQYSGGVLVNKKFETFTGFSSEFRSNGTLTNIDLGGTSNGTWQLLSPSYYVIDLNTVNERYYYILSINDLNLVIRGPFSRTGGLVSNFLTTSYLKK